VACRGLLFQEPPAVSRKTGQAYPQQIMVHPPASKYAHTAFSFFGLSVSRQGWQLQVEAWLFSKD